MQSLTLEQFRATHDAGAVLSVTLKAEGAAFEMLVETRRGIAYLVNTRKDRVTGERPPRRFADPRKALVLLRELSIREARINVENWRPDEREYQRQPRPDRAEAMRAAHAALGERARKRI